MQRLCVLLLLVNCFSGSYGRSELDMLRVAYSNVEKETIAGEVTIESGSIPQWLNGTFIRHSCGAFGETGGDLNSPIVNYVDHLFDCIEMGTSFKFEDGQVSFYNRYYDTNMVDIYNAYDKNMNESKVFWKTILANFDFEKSEELLVNLTAGFKTPLMEHVAWWRIGDRVAAYSEGVNGYWVDIHNVENHGKTQYHDGNMGYPVGTLFVNNPAHPHTDPDGTLWSVCLTYVPVGPSGIYSSRYTIYTLVDETRSVVAEITLGEVDLSVCAGYGEPYPDLEARQGYMHSFSMTENYIILPTASFLFDPCALAEGWRPDMAFFKGCFQWYGDHDSILYVIRRSDGQLMASIPSTAFFVTHQLNSYEQDGFMYLDMLLYANSDIYTYNTYLPQLLENIPYDTYVERFTINMEDWTLVSRSQLRNPAPASIEMSNINYEYYNGKPYEWAYMAENIFVTDGRILKLNVNTGEELIYRLPEGLFPQEPVFVSFPEPEHEDDGVLLVQGVDGVQEKGFLIILDARSMEVLAHVTAPDLALAGLHNNFFPAHVGHG